MIVRAYLMHGAIRTVRHLYKISTLLAAWTGLCNKLLIAGEIAFRIICAAVKNVARLCFPLGQFAGAALGAGDVQQRLLDIFALGIA